MYFKRSGHGTAISICVASVFFATQLFATQPALAPAAGARPPAGKRTVLSVVVLDSLNTDLKSQIEAREAVRTMLETLPPGNRMAIFALGDRLHMLHDFSSNPAPLLAAVDQYDGEQPFWWVGSRDSSTSLLAAQFPSSEAAPWGQRPAADTAAAAFAQEQRVLTTFDAMTTIAKIMGHASGRKYLLWVSSAFPLRWYPPEAVQAIRAMNKAGLALYAIDPRGILESFAGEANVDTMKELAEQTGGRTFYGNNDVGSLLRLAAAVLSNEE
jgi:VWFA-related protein